LLLLDDRRAILDYTDIFFTIDLAKRGVLTFHKKSSNTFIILGSDQKFYFFASYLLFHVNFDSFHAELEDNYFVSGLGQFSELKMLVPGSSTFIAGIQNIGNPKYPEQSFGILEKHYSGLDDIWNLVFTGMAVKPPVSPDGYFIIAQEDLVRIVSNEGKIKDEIEGKFAPIWSSIGPDNLIYLLYNNKQSTFVRVFDFEGNVHWEQKTSIRLPTQPPIISNESMVFIIGSSKIEAMVKGEKIWEFQLKSSHELSQLASVTQDGKLLVSDGNRVVCLNELGIPVWIYEDDENDDFVTQPVLDSNGSVFVATNKKIVVLN